MGQTRDTQVSVLCASMRTLGKSANRERFPPKHFDYLVIDEFHHDAAPTYRRLLGHSDPRFLLGVTDRLTPPAKSDFPSLRVDNLLFTCDPLARI